MIHNLGTSAKCTDRSSAADHFSERTQVRFDSIDFLRSAARETKPGNYFVKNQERTMLRAFLTQDGQEILSRKIKPSIRGDRFKDYSRDLIFIFVKCLSHKIGIVERERNR